MPQPELQERFAAIEGLVRKLESAADPALRRTAQELVQSVMDLHSAGLERLLELIRADFDGGENVIPKLERDELVGNLLVLHGLHSMSIEERVSQGLEKARQKLRVHDGEVGLLSIRDGTVRLRLRANGHGCGSTADALKEVVETAVYQSAPDVISVVIEGLGEKQGFIPIEMLQGTAR